jgi:hypothetical protein
MSSWQVEVDTINKVVVATTDPGHRKAKTDIIDSNSKQPRDVEDITDELDATSVTTWLDPRMFNFAFSMLLDSTIDEKPFRSCHSSESRTQFYLPTQNLYNTESSWSAWSHFEWHSKGVIAIERKYFNTQEAQHRAGSQQKHTLIFWICSWLDQMV